MLGPVEVTVDGTAVDLGPRKQRAVLGVLIALAPAAVSVDRLIEELWGDGGPRNPLRSLQVYVSALRSALGEYGDRLVTEGRAYRLATDDVTIDAERFRGLAREAANEPDPAGVLEHADGALALWRGAPWQDLRDLPVVDPEVLALEAERLAVLAARGRALLALGRHRELVPWLEPLVAQHPLHEELRGQLMLALHRGDRQADALAVYEEGRLLKAEETGLDPGEDLQRLQGAILVDDPALRVEDVELRSRRHLPAQVTSLVGREPEITGVVELLRKPDHRLVTITGPGGIGKTRLGVATAHALAADHPDGVWFVGLDALHDHRLVAGAIADVLGVEIAGGDMTAALVEHLRDRRLMLVLDNFEQVEDAAPLVSELLAAAPELRVLVTSRVRLRLYGEQVVRLEPLAPRDAVPLFVDRARAVDAGFAAPVDVVADLCDQLDRMPLAIELVAARADEVPLATLREQLAARRALDVATDGPRDRGTRQRTLRDAISWSVDLLPSELAARFARLAIFDGGFTAEAAAAVADMTAADLATLERASLVVDAGGGRFRMLETLREYAGELLAEDRARVADAHAEWYSELVLDSVGRSGLHEWIELLDPDRANLRAALERLGETYERDVPVGARVLELASVLGLYWYTVGPGSADTEWLPRALELAPDAAPAVRGKARYALAICRAEQGLVAEAIEQCRLAYDLLRDGGDASWAARALNSLAGLTHDIGRSEEAAVLMDESIALRRSLDGALPLAIPLSNRATVAVHLGDAATARACLEEIIRTEGDRELEGAFALLRMADVELLVDDPDAAAFCLRTALDAVLERDYQDYRLMECLDTFAALAVVRGRPELAATLLAAADRAYAAEGSVMVPADIEFRQRRTGAAVDALAEEARREAEERGAALDLAAAVRLAREELL